MAVADQCSRFRSLHGRDLVGGIDILIPVGGIPMMVLSKEHGFAVDGVPVLDGVAPLVKNAEMAVKLHRFNGTAVSCRGAFIRPPSEVVDELLEYQRKSAGVVVNHNSSLCIEYIEKAYHLSVLSLSIFASSGIIISPHKA